MKSELRLLIGLPGSHKTTYALGLKAQSEPGTWQRVNWDESRKATPGYRPGKFSRGVELQMQKKSFEYAEHFLKLGVNVVVDNTNLNPGTRNQWKGVAERAGAEYTEYVMPASVLSCIHDDHGRTGDARVGRAVIERMALKSGLIKFAPTEKLVIVDMDGTLSDSSMRQKYVSGPGKKDWASFFGKVGEDNTNPFVEKWVLELSKAGFTILIVSGRSIDQAGKLTEDWLDSHNIPYRHLFMRNSGDKREDTVVKKGILDLLPKEQIVFCIDDRPSVIRMWKENGVKCFDVGEGKEF